MMTTLGGVDMARHEVGTWRWVDEENVHDDYELRF